MLKGITPAFNSSAEMSQTTAILPFFSVEIAFLTSVREAGSLLIMISVIITVMIKVITIILLVNTIMLIINNQIGKNIQSPKVEENKQKLST